MRTRKAAQARGGRPDMTISMAAKEATIRASKAMFIVGVVYGMARALSSGGQRLVDIQRLQQEGHDQVALNVLGFLHFEMAQLHT